MERGDRPQLGSSEGESMIIIIAVGLFGLGFFSLLIYAILRD